MSSPEQTVRIDFKPRFRVFIDFWNFQITLNERENEATGQQDVHFKIDWKQFPAWVVGKAAEVVGINDYSYEGTIVYTSYNPAATDASFKRWLTTWLDRQPGIQVVARERQPKSAPRCNLCHQEIQSCPSCGNRLAGTIEKGIDTALVTDMIRLAWEGAYDVGIVVSSDRDLVPVVEFLDSKGRKIIQGGFPPSGLHLATACWASFDLFALREEYRRN